MILELIPRWAFAAALAALLALCGVQTWRLASSAAALGNERAAHQSDLARMASAAASASEAARFEEQRRTVAQQGIIRHAETAQDTIRAAAVRASDAGDGLRFRAAAVAASCDPATSDPAASGAGPAASSPGDLLADVLGRMDEAGRQLAAEADRRGVAGAACESGYGSLTQ